MSPVNPRRVSFGPAPASPAPDHPVAASPAPVHKPSTPVKVEMMVMITNKL